MKTVRHSVAILLLMGFQFSVVCVSQMVTLHLEEGKSGTVWDLRLSKDAKLAVSCGRDSTVKIWNLMTGEVVRTFRASKPTLNTCLAISPDDKILAVGDMNGVITQYSMKTGNPEHEFKAHASYIQKIQFAQNGDVLITAGRDNEIKFWDTSSKKLIRAISAGQLWINSIAVSHNGKILATAGQDGNVSLWDVGTGSLITVLGKHRRYVKSICFSPDDAYLFSGGREGQILVWDVSRKTIFSKIQLQNGFARDMTISKSGVSLFVSMMNNTIQVWDWEKNLMLKKLGTNSYGAMTSCFDDASNRLFSAHTDGSVKIWNMDNQSLVLNLVGFSDGQWLSYTPDGYYDCSSSGDRYVQWKVGDDFYPLERYATIYHQPGIIEDALTGSYHPEVDRPTLIQPPVVHIQAPRNNQFFSFGSENLEIVVQIKAEDEKSIAGIDLFLNGRAVNQEMMLESQEILRTSSKLVQRFRIPVLHGVNSLEAVAHNSARVTSNPENISFIVETQDRQRANLFVFGVGVDEYTSGFSTLLYPSHDATTLTQTLQKQEGKLFGRVYSKLLVNKDATKKSILNELSEFQGMTNQDVLILFFGGHGVRARDERGQTKYYFVPSDAGKASITKQGVSWDDVVSRVDKVKAGRVILLLDACHSGSISSGASNEKVAASLSKKIGLVFSSSSGNEFSFENKAWGHGAFTKAILDGLQGEADFTHDGIIDWSELQLFVTNEVKSMTSGGQNPTIPRLVDFSNFEIARIR